MAIQVNVSFTVEASTNIIDIVEHVNKIAVHVNGVHMEIGPGDAVIKPVPVIAPDEPEAPKPAAKKKTKKKAASKKKAAPEPEPEPEPEGNPNFKGPTVDDVRAAVSTLMKARGGETAREILNAFEAANISALYEEQFADVIAAVNAELEKEAP